MRNKIVGLVALISFCACAVARADFKYTESSKITGGALNSAMKVAGVFSKRARETRQAMVSTVYVKGNRMRRDNADGTIQIIDLDGRRIINIDSQKQTYSIMTFDQMRQALEQAKAQAQEEQQKQAAQAKHPNVTITPKFLVTPASGSQVILRQNTHEVKVSLQMEMQSDDPQAKGQTATFSMNSDEYLAPSVPGYQEVQDFGVKLARELDWVPGAVFGGNAQIRSMTAEAAKHADELRGFPLLMYSSFGGASSGEPGASGAQPQSGQSSSPSQPPKQPASMNPLSMSPSGAAAKALGGIFGHRKKKNSEDQSASPNGGPPPPSTPGSLMDMTIEVTSYSDSALDGSLFEIPAAYQQIASDPNRLIR